MLRFLSILILSVSFFFSTSALHAQSYTDRPSDSLLFRQPLQEIFNQQVVRNGAALIQYLHHPKADIRARAAFALASVQTRAALPSLLRLLRDPAPQVRADVAFALGQIADSSASWALLSALKAERDPVVQYRLLEALGKTGGIQALNTLITFPLPPWQETRRAEAIDRFGIRGVHHPSAIRYLLLHLQASHAPLRQYAAYYFGRSNAVNLWAPYADSLRKALQSYQLDDPAAMYLIQAIGRLHVPSDTSLLAYWMRQATDWRTRVNAARASRTWLQYPAIRKALFQALQDSSEHVALTAARTLSQATPDSALVEAFTHLITSPVLSWRVQAALLPLLARAGETGRVVYWMDQQPPENFRAYAHGLRALGNASDSLSFAVLARAVQSLDPFIATTALEALSTRWHKEKSAEKAAIYFPLFASGLQRKDVGTVYVAAHALSDTLFSDLGAPILLRATYRALYAPQDIESMTAIIQALRAFPDTTTIAFLRQVLYTAPHPVLQHAAAQTLHHLTDSLPSPTPVPPSDTLHINWEYLRRYGMYPRLIFETEKGTFTVVLFSEQAPLTTQTLIQLTEQGLFNEVPFHRVVPNFVIQGGDFLRQDGFGTPPFTIRSEFTRINYLRGTAGMASAGKNTEGSQYFITHSMQPHLDGRYTAFGYVIEGMNVVDHIYEGDRVLRVRVIPDTLLQLDTQ